jgi:hypothetical protein
MTDKKQKVEKIMLNIKKIHFDILTAVAVLWIALQYLDRLKVW